MVLQDLFDVTKVMWWISLFTFLFWNLLVIVSSLFFDKSLNEDFSYYYIDVWAKYTLLTFTFTIILSFWWGCEEIKELLHYTNTN